MTVYLVYEKFYDFQSNTITIGGIQTYLQDLIAICKDKKYKIEVIQMGNEECYVEKEGYCVKQYVIHARYKADGLAKRLKSDIDEQNSLVVFATDSIIPLHVQFLHSLAIQHGISWDKPVSTQKSLKTFVLRTRDNCYLTHRLNSVNRVICVDYNFVNWYRALTQRYANNFTVIPNYTRISEIHDKPAETTNIIFARRLFWYRGTRLFVKAIKPILNDYKNISVTIAGTGPDEKWMKEELQEYSNVSFIKYKSTESLAIHADKHIAVIPTVGSEGTSLSLLEAMSAQCAVVCSNVGGMSNIVIDGYNGLMISPQEKELEIAMRKLLDDPARLKQLAARAYDTVVYGFSHTKWQESWIKVFDEFENKIKKNA